MFALGTNTPAVSWWLEKNNPAPIWAGECLFLQEVNKQVFSSSCISRAATVVR